ncbi:MAG: cytochrome c [Alphaproteobacteria bacterium]
MGAGAPAVAADDTDTAAGAAFVEANCAVCHAVDREGASPHRDAPAFRTLSQRYPVESLAEALAEGILVGHPDMPEFALEPDQIDGVIAYLQSIQD